MKTISQAVALGSLCALLAGAATAASAQDNGGYPDHHGNQGGYSQYQGGRHQYNQDRQYGDSQYRDSQYRRSDQYRHAGAAERRRLDRLHAAYARAAARGHYGAAERDHAHAQAIRARLRDQRSGQGRGGDQGRDQGQYQGDQRDHHGDNPGDLHPHDNN